MANGVSEESQPQGHSGKSPIGPLIVMPTYREAANSIYGRVSIKEVARSIGGQGVSGAQENAGRFAAWTWSGEKRAD